MAGAPTATAFKFDAFISYSHQADDVLAPALHRALHEFARPRFKKRALHVFRDQTTLSANPELWTAIEAALSSSRFLLLMAAPASAASRWVRRELAWWMEHRSPQTMLVLVTDGELVWDEDRSDFNWARTTSVPREALGGRLTQEPLWVDLRWARNGETLTLRHGRFRQAVLDIAAPLHGRDKDELDGEDVRLFLRSQRVRKAVTAGLVVLTTVAVAAGAVAYVQRDRALRQTLIVRLERLSVQADLLRARGEPADASVMLAAEALAQLSRLGEAHLEADLALRGALAGQPITVREFDFPDRRYRLTAAGRVLVTQDPTVDALGAYGLPGGEFVSCDVNRINTAHDGAQPAGGPAWALALSAGGRWCIVRRDAKRYELWSAQPLQRVASWQEAASTGRPVFAVSEDGAVLARTARNHEHQLAASALRVWHRSTGQDLLQRRGAEFLQFSPDAQHFATTEGVWRLPADGRGAAVRLWAWTGVPIDLAFSTSGGHVAVRMEVAGKLQIWSLAKRELLYELDRVPPGQLAALADGAWALAVVGKAQAWLWDVMTDRARVRLPQAVEAAAIDGGDLVALVEIGLGNGTTRQRILRLPWNGAAFAATPLPAGLDAQTIESIEVDQNTVRLAMRNEPEAYGLVWTAGDDRWTKVDARPAVLEPAAAASAARSLSTASPTAAADLYGVRATDLSVIVTREGVDLLQLDVPTGPRLAGVSRDGLGVAIIDMANIVSLHHIAADALIAQACARKPQALAPGLRQLVPGPATADVCGQPLAPASPARSETR